MKAPIHTQEGKSSGEVSLNETIFGAKVNNALLFEAVHSSMANKRQGTQSTKSRSEIRGGGKKPYKQKGTGNARQGSTRASQFVGGGTMFGPKPRSYEYRIPKKQRKSALISALSQKASEGTMAVFAEFKASKPQTKAGIKFLGDFATGTTLVVDIKNEVLWKSVRNVKNTKYLEAEGLNVYDVLRYKTLLISQAALKRVEERLGA
jgi:large subunit ribosomal protein L4